MRIIVSEIPLEGLDVEFQETIKSDASSFLARAQMKINKVGDELDLSDLVKEQIILNLPMKPLCNDSCKGICLQCGTDLNSFNCSCSERGIDPRLEVLKNFRCKAE